MKYNTFQVGPVTASTKVQSGETTDAAYLRLNGVLSAMYECEFAVRSQQFLERLEDVAHLTQSRRSSR